MIGGKLNIRLLIGLLCALGIAAVAEAQQAPQFTFVREISVKPDMVNEFEDLVTSELLPALKKAGAPGLSTFRTATFGEAYQYTMLSPIANFAQFDTPSPLFEALGEAGIARFIAKLNKCITSMRTVGTLGRPDLGIQPDTLDPKGLWVVVTEKVTAGKEQEYAASLGEDLRGILKKLEIDTFIVWQTVFGGDSNEWVYAVRIPNHAIIDGGPPAVQALGPEGAAALAEKTAGLTWSSEITMVRFVPELSFAAN